ncbi:protein KRI1 homolog [Dendronephthya gigantea]|uniref:protein KRI1 homolog n=1 Tax=Dendronephthya gigantea TaxID=151771 RepID=UPI00106ADB16|nr:protein KRI1 homolog [Dendronephthya gigantea]
MADGMEYEDCVLTVNQAYAGKFQKKSEKAELDRLRDKYGDNNEDSESSSETEDEDAKDLNMAKERDFLKTLALIKNKDPKIYKKDAKFYSDDKSINAEDEKSKKSSKPIYLKDYERERLLRKGSEAFEISSDEEEKQPSLTYVEEQEELKKSLKDAVNAVESNKDDFLTKRKKSKQEKEIDDKNYADWLEKRNFAENDRKELEPLMKHWNDPNLDENEKFLRNFILQRQYIDRDSLEIKTYDEVVADFDEEEDEIEEQEEFERVYNFRFEEPDAVHLKSYPRNVAGSLRRKDDSRKDRRQKRNERKLKEKEQKKEELKRLKNLKKKEILEKLEKLKEVTGNPNVGFGDEDLEGDFDPAKYDEAMQKAFNDDYYNEEEAKKPEFNDDDYDDFEEENWDDWEGHTGGELHCDDPGFNMDADYDVNTQTTKNDMNKGKGKSAFSKALYSAKPTFDPEEKSFEQYFDEYYKLDYEDIIGDLPCRFKYREVEPNDFGLTVDEILRCDDKELNQWASLKKSTQYRTKEEEKKDVKRYRQKGRDLKKKMLILQSLATTDNNTEETAENHNNNNDARTKNSNYPTEKRLNEIAKKVKGGGKWRWKGKGRISVKDREEQIKKRRVMRHFRGAKSDKLSKLSSSRLLSYGVRKKKKSNKM